MNEITLDAARIRRLCSELNLSLREIGSVLATSGNTVLRLLEGLGDADAITLGELKRLGSLLGVDAASLLVSSTETTIEPLPDDVVVECTLARIGVAVTRTQIASGLGWDLRRVRRAVTRLEKRLTGTGVILHRIGTRTICLRGRDDVLSDEQRTRLDRTELRRRGLTPSAARLLLRVAHGETLAPITLSRPGVRRWRGELLRGGLVEEDLSGNLALHKDVAFSLGLPDA